MENRLELLEKEPVFWVLREFEKRSLKQITADFTVEIEVGPKTPEGP